MQVLLQPMLVVRLGDDGDVPLGGPPQEDLRRGLLVLLSERGDDLVFEQERGVEGILLLELGRFGVKCVERRKNGGSRFSEEVEFVVNLLQCTIVLRSSSKP